MTDIEIKRKELETAKRIRDNGYSCAGLPGCKELECPCDPNPSRQNGCRTDWMESHEKWDSFIATREAELAALDKAQKPEPLYPRAKGATGPTLDDFALALIQGGYFDRGETGDVQALFLEAAELKAESDRRRGI